MRKILFLSLCLMATFASAKKLTTNYRNALVLAYSQVNSIYEDDNIKLEIYGQRLWITNKTEKTIFIDKSQCFLVNNGSSYPMWEKDQDEKKASKAKNSTSIDEFLSIAPSVGSKQNATAIGWVSKKIFGRYSSTESPSEDFSEYDKRLLNIISELVTESKKADPKNEECLGTVTRHITEDESVSNIGASIAYAFSKRADDWTSVTISTWVSDVIFAPFYVELPEELSKKEKRGFNVKETDPATIHIKADSPFEFEEDRSPIVVCDWRGNYKKGIFELSPIMAVQIKKTGLLANILTLGYASLFNYVNQTQYKDIVKFEGSGDDWGKMTHVDTITKTGRED